MALMQCPNCGKKISDRARNCPHCGTALTKEVIDIEAREITQSRATKKLERTKTITKPIGIGIVVLLLIATIFFIANRLSPEEKYEVEKVMDSIAQIGDVDLYSGDKIQIAEEQYQQLSSKCKRKVKNKKELKAAKTKWNTLEAENVSEQIEKIGEIKIGSELKLQLAKTAYDKLTDEQKKLVKNTDKITQAEEKLSELKVENMEKLINEIKLVKVDKETKEKITTAEDTYNTSLTEEEQAKVNNIDQLVVAKKHYRELAVQNCITMIDAIGEVTLESGDAVQNATEAYMLLFSEDKDKITNHATLDNATKKLIELKKEDDERKKNMKEGDTLTTPKWEVTYKRTRISAKILPNNTSGYYQYYYADDDSVYVDMIFNVKNVSSDRLSLNNVITSAKVSYGEKYNYTSYSTFYSYGNDIDAVYSWDGLEALHSTTFHVAVKLPRVAQTSTDSIKATLVIAGEEKIIKIR